MVLVAPVQPSWAGGCHNCCLPGVLSVHLLVPAWEALVALLKYQFLQPWGDAELSPKNRSRQQETWQHDQAVAEGPPNTFLSISLCLGAQLMNCKESRSITLTPNMWYLAARRQMRENGV